MAKTIEQRVVEFKFNNADFERNVSKSMGTLDNLNKKLKDSTSGDAFKELGKAANGLSFDGVTSTITKVTEKFSVLEQIAVGALRNIGASIEEHLVSGLKKVTVDNVLSGFQRYGEKTKSVATIMAAIANEDYGDVDKLGYVEELLEKLAWFSDETSYNFTDMTDNISKFTAAGLDLDTSTTAMIGIANWAANAGQNAQVASRAMYQLSQAMGMGSIQLIDWKSIEIANMATKEVKELMLEYGLLLGELEKFDDGNYVVAGELQDTLKKLREGGDISESLINTSNFRQHLTEEKWLTTDVFAAAMGEYASYSEALHNIISDSANEDLDLYATDLMKKISKALKKAEKTGLSLDDILMQDYGITTSFVDDDGNVRSYLADVTELGIRAMESAQKARTFEEAMASIQDAASTKWAFAFEKLFGNMEQATELWTYLSEVLYNVFAEPLNGLNELLKVWKKFEGREALFGSIDEEGELINGAFQNLLITLVGDGDEILGYLDGIKAGFSAVFNPDELDTKELGEKLAEATKNFRGFTEGLIPTEEKLEKVKQAVITIISPFKSLGGVIGSIVGSGKSFVSGFLSTFSKVFDYTKIDFEPKKRNFGDVLFEATDFTTSTKLIESPIKTMSKLFTNLGNIISRFFNALRPSEKALSKLRKALEGAKVIIDTMFYPVRLLNEKLEELLDPDSTKIEKLAKFFGGPFLEVILWLPSKIGEGIVALEEMLKKFNIFEKIGGFLSSAWKGITGFIDGFVKAANLDFKWIDKVKGFFSDLFDFDKKINGTNVFKTISDGLDSITKWFNSTDFASSGEKVFTSISSAIKNFGDAFSNLTGINFETLGSDIASFADTIWQALKKIGEGIAGLFKSEKGSVFSSLGDSLNSLFKMDTNKLRNLDLISEPFFSSSLFPEGKTGRSRKVVGQGSDIFKRGDGLGFKASGMQKEISEAESLIIGLDDFSEALSGMDSSGVSVVRAMEDVSDSASDIEESGVSVLATVVSALAKAILFVASVFVRLFDIGFKVIEFISNSIVNIYNKIAEVFDKKEAQSIGDVVIGVIEFIAGVLDAALPIISKIVTFILDLSGDGISIIVDAIGFIFGKIGEISTSDTFTKIIDVIKSIFSSILGGVNEFAESETVKALLKKMVSVIEYIIKSFLRIAPMLALLMTAKGFMSLGTGIKRIGSGIKSIGSALNKKSWADVIGSIADVLKGIAAAAVGISASFVMLKNAGIEKFEDMSPYILAIGALLAEVFLAIGLIMKFGAGEGKGKSKVFGSFVSEIAEFGTNASALAAIPFILASVAALVLSISKAIGNLAAVKKGMKEGEFESMVDVMKFFIGETLLLTALIASQAKTTKGLSGIKGFLLGLATFIAVTIASISKLASIKPEGLFAGTAAIEVLLITIVALLERLSVLKKVDAAELVGFAAVLIALGLSIKIIVGAIATLLNSGDTVERSGGGGGSSVLGIIVSVAAIAGAIYVMGEVLGKLAKKSKGWNLPAAAASLLIMAEAVLIMARVIAAFTLLAQNDLGSFAIGFIAFAVALAGLVIAAKSLEYVNTESFLIFAAAVLVLGLGMMAVVKSIEMFIDMVITLGDTISEHKDSIMNGLMGLSEMVLAFLRSIVEGAPAIITAFIVGIITAIGNSATEIVDAFLEFIEKFLDALAKRIPKITKSLNEIFVAILKFVTTFIKDSYEEIVNLITDLLTIAIKALAKFIEDNIETLTNMVVNVLTIIFDAIGTFLLETGLPKLEEIVTDLIDRLFNVLDVLLTKLEEFVPKLLDFVFDLLEQVIDKIVEFVPKIIDAATTLIQALADGIIDAVDIVLDAITELIVGKEGEENGGIIGKIGSFAKRLGEAAGDLIDAFIEGILACVDKVKKAFIKLFEGYDDENGKHVNGILEGVGEMFGAVLKAIADLLNGIADAIRGGVPEITDAAVNLSDAIVSSIPLAGDLYDLGKDAAKSLAEALVDTPEDFDTPMEEFCKTLKINAEDEFKQLGNDVGWDLIAGILEGLKTRDADAITAMAYLANGMIDEANEVMGIESPSKVFKAIGEYVVEGLTKGIEAKDKEPGGALGSILSGLTGLFKKDSDAKESGSDITKDISSGMSSEIGSVEKATKQIVSKIDSVLSSSKVLFEKCGANISNILSNGIKGNFKSSELAGKSFTSNVLSGVSSLTSSLQNAGRNATIHMIKGMDDNISIVENASRNLVSKIKETINSEDYSSCGSNIVSGIVKGITKNSSLAEKESRTLATNVKKTIHAVLDINSPSRVMMETGKFIDLGLAKGIDKYAEDPIASTEEMSNLLILAMTNAMQMAAAALEDENYSPVISPVIDLTEIQNGMRDMDGIIYGNGAYSVNAAMRSRYDPYENFDGTLKEDPNSDLLYSVNSVTSKLDEMLAKVDKLKIYLDSGQLVGGIVDKMDNALGRKMVYAGRGNI